MKKILSLIIVISVLLTAVSINVLAVGMRAEDMYREGMEFFEKEDYDRAFSYFQISGEVKGYAPAQNMLGVCYRDGLGIEADIAEAEKYFKLSADQGYGPAQVNLAAIQRTVLIDNSRLTVSYSVEDLLITLKGLEIKDQYITNKDSSEQSVLEYGWMVEFTDYHHKYSVRTASWAFSPGSNQAKSIDGMQHSIFVDGRRVGSSLKIEHTGTSITWRVRLASLAEEIDFSLIKEFDVRVIEDGNNYLIDEKYPLEVELPVDGEYEYIILQNGNVQITQYLGSQGDVKIPEKLNGRIVTMINDKAFSGRNDLISVEIPGSIEEIPSGAFQQCSNLKTVTIMEGVKTIGVVAFWECKNLEKVQIPSSVTTIGWNNASVFWHDTSRLHVLVKQGSFAEEYCSKNNIRYSYY